MLGPGSLRRLALGLFLGVLLPGVGRSGAAEIRIGEVDSLTGRFAAQGTALHQGILLAVEEAREDPGFRPHALTLVPRDDEGRPDRAVAAAEELIGRHQVVALVGGYVDSLVGPLSEAAERHRRPYVATASLDERLTQRGYRYFFRVSSLQGYVEATVGAALDLFRVRRVAILSSSTPGASQLGTRQRQRLEGAGVQVAPFEQFRPGTADFTPIIQRLRGLGIDLFIANAFFGDHLVLVRQMRGQEVAAKAFLGTFGLEFPEVVRELGAASEGLFGTTGWEPGVTTPGTEQASAAFVTRYRGRFGADPPPLAMHGYAAAQTTLAALRASLAGGRAPDPDAVRTELARLDLLTPLARIRFDERGDPRHYQRVVLQIRQGRHVVVYPPARATGPALYPAPPWRTGQ